MSSTTVRQAPQPPGLPILGNLSYVRGGHLMAIRAQRQFGDIVRYKVGPMTMHLLAHPDYARHVLVDNKENYAKGLGYAKAKLLLGDGLFVSEGQFWRRQRRLMQPPFTAKSVPTFTGKMVDSTLSMLRRWQEFERQDQAFEMNREMVRITMSIIGKTMLGIDLAEESGAVSAALLDVLDFVGRKSVSVAAAPMWVPTPDNRRFKRSMNILDGVVEKVLAHNQANPTDDDHLLAKLLKAKDPETGEGMTASQIRDEVITIFLAGHETTALLLTWTWHLLSEYPEVEARLHAELDTVLAGRPPRAEDLEKLDYTRMVIEETLRLYPPVWMFPRDAINADEIGGYEIPAKSMVFVSPYLAHHDPRFWNEPEKFDPERFAPDKKLVRNAYFPFGMGPRTCIGNHFALMEAIIVLATIAQQFRPRPVSSQKVEPSSVATFRPKDGIYMKVQRRPGAPALV